MRDSGQQRHTLPQVNETVGGGPKLEANKRAHSATPEEIARAKKLMKLGEAYYMQGRYEQAEENLKQALQLYPFVAKTNLLLGKVFLIRGSADRNQALLNNARLMFEMARALDPKLPEVQILLQLFSGPET